MLTLSINSVAKATLAATVELGWSCKFLQHPLLYGSLIIRDSAVNSDESSGRNFAAFQNVAKALNGTAVAATVPSATSQASGALSMRTGGASAMVLVASFVAAFL